MKLGYRKARSFILLFAGLLALGLSHTFDGFSVILAISLLISSAMTLVYVFLHFDEEINAKVVMEMIMDGFSGLVIFTYPESNEYFLLIVFSFWILIMGMLYLTSGLLDEKNKEFLWSYVLLGIMLMVMAFVIINFDEAYKNSVLYVVGFTLMIYSGANLYLLYKNKRDIY